MLCTKWRPNGGGGWGGPVDAAALSDKLQGAAKWVKKLIFLMRNFDILLSTYIELLNLIKGDSINGSDFFNLMISHSNSHCDYSPRVSKPSCITGCAFSASSTQEDAFAVQTLHCCSSWRLSQKIWHYVLWKHYDKEIQVFRIVRPCRTVNTYRRFGGTYFFHYQGQ